MFSKHSNNYVVLFITLLLMFVGVSFAQPAGWSKYGSNPISILDNLAEEANDTHRIQETALDDVSPLQGQYPSQYRLTNMLDSLRQNIGPYLRWLYFLGMAIGVLALLYNALLMVTNSFHGKGDWGESKKRLVNIALGVIVLSGIYAIIAIFMSLLGRIIG